MNPLVKTFTAELEALCRKYSVTLSYSSMDECLTITPAAEGGIEVHVEVHVEFREPPKPYVPPPPTPEELARTAELDGLAAASRETWENRSFPGSEGDNLPIIAPKELDDFEDGYIPGDMFVMPKAKP